MLNLNNLPASAIPLPPREYAYEGIVVNHTHWDREWYMPFQRYRVLLVDAVDKLLEILREQHGYGAFLLDGQTAVAEDYLEVRPEKAEELIHYVREGRVRVGPWYVLPDEFIPSGESLIRNLLFGRQQMSALGAPAPTVGYLPDTFGHPAQLPQILAGFDLGSAVIFRGVRSDTSEFLWEGPDGTRLLTIYLPGGYFNAMELARAPRFWLEERMQGALEQLARFATTRTVLLMNGCDHFEPQPATQAILDAANSRQNLVFLWQGTLEEYVEQVRAEASGLKVKEGEWRYNRPARITPGVLSARMYLKQADFKASVTLERGAEPLQALAWATNGKHDSGLLEQAWRYLLQNHPHDSICGCSVDEVHQDGAGRYRWAQQIGDDLVERAITRLAAYVSRTSQPDSQARPGFMILNTLAVPRTEMIRQRLHFLTPGEQFSLQRPDGTPVPHQELSRRPMKLQWDPQRRHFHCEGRVYPATVVSTAAQNYQGERWQRWEGEEVEVLFQADLPAGGYLKVVLTGDEAATDKEDSSEESSLRWGEGWLENEMIRLDVAEDGSFHLLDKTTGREYGPLNVFRSEADRGDEYSFCPVENDLPVSTRGGKAEITLADAGPLRATLVVKTNLAVPARLAEERDRRVAETVILPITSYISLGPGRGRVEIRTEVDNRASDQRLRVLFMSGVQTEWADAQGQFQVMRRAVELPAEERARVPQFDEEQEVSYHPQRAFVDVSDDRGGLAVLNRGLPEYEAEPSAKGVWLGLTLLRCVGWLSRDDLSTRYKHAGPPLETPDAQCHGRHVFEYALVPHRGDWLEGGVAQEAEAYITPVHSGPLPLGDSGNSAYPEASFYALEPAELLFSALKRSENGRTLVLRAYNTAPYAVEGKLKLGFKARVCKANLAERLTSSSLPFQTVNGAYEYTFPVNRHEIITLSIDVAEEEVGE
ncbi:MAG TPA: glycoside hydrolase family 38 C-terminal domain-containing protein [Chloroflexia bacterium]|nr:glycoside hydrolase family 38 C-terminal domain-containing protein [Chloroflexia bacterium]